MEKLKGVSEESKGILVSSGSPPNSSASASTNASGSSSREIALPFFSNASSTAMDLSFMTLEQLRRFLHGSNLSENSSLHLREASSCRHPTCNQKICKIKAMQLWETPGIVFKLLQTPGVDDNHIQFIRVSSLGFIGSLLKCDDPVEAKHLVHLMLKTEVFPLCLGCIEKGDILTQDVAVFVVARILMQEEGIKYCTDRVERFYSVVQVLTRMVDQLAVKPRVSLLRRVVFCFRQLSSGEKRSQGLTDTMRRNIPTKLVDDTFREIFRANPDIVSMMEQLLSNVTPKLGSNP
ncbi:hypothetical protein ACH5RR_029222 [Cinchona calisaya]|uniref:Cell differentiation protein rcd1 n=1 Tax=Cinchona calisaya TaxID=153742 RepID=A0ABD2YSG8_9GENT